MRILAVNTAGLATEIALIDGDRTFDYRDDRFRQASAELMPAADRLFRDAGFTVRDADAFAVCVGPGSFTGIRIGLSAVRAFCFALGKPAIAVNMGEVLAYNILTDADSIISVWDAGNGFAYLAAYENPTMHELLAPRCVKENEVQAFLSEIDEPFAVSTDTKMRRFGTVGQEFGLAAAVRARALTGAFVGYGQLLPQYVRKSQAEENARD